MIDNTKEYILCAAIKRKKPITEHICYYDDLKQIYSIEIGYRHPDIMYRFFREMDMSPDSQGTSKGRFVNRKEAAQTAFKCGQTIELKNQLFSGNIY